jgi:nucleoside 2-deoxyribosyltransferase
MRTFESGAVRDGGKKPALQLISPHAMNRLGEWLRFACEDRLPHPYPARNWEKGLPFSSTIASIQRHVEKFKLGDTSEDHVAAILFGGMALAHFEEEIKAGRLPPTLDDMPHYLSEVGVDGPHKTPMFPIGTRQVRPDGTIDRYMYIQPKDIVVQTAQGPAVFPAKGRPEIGCTDPVKVLSPVDYLDPAAVVRISDNLTRFFAEEQEPIRIVEHDLDLEELKAVAAYEVMGVDVASGPSATVFGIIDNPFTPAPTWMNEFLPGSPLAGIHSDEPIGVESRNEVLHVKKPFKVYLCGPITGQPVDSLWRDAATVYLAAHGIETLDPLRGKDTSKISGDGLLYNGVLASPEMGTRDKGDVQDCDIVLAHFPYMPPRQSIGSLMEMGAAAIGMDKPVVLCTTLAQFNNHLFCRKFCIIEPDFEMALKTIVHYYQGFMENI